MPVTRVGQTTGPGVGHWQQAEPEPGDDARRLEQLYSRYRATLLHVAACVLAGRGRRDARREAADLASAARAAVAPGTRLEEQFELGAQAGARLVAWIAADLRATATEADMDAVRRTHRAFRAAVWEVTGHCEYAPCGTGRQVALRA